MSPSAENPSLCWKCQALLNSIVPSDLDVTQDWEMRHSSESNQTRVLKTTSSVEETAIEGCALCLRLLHGLNAPARVALSQLTTLAKTDSELVVKYEYCSGIYEDLPPCVSLYVYSESKHATDVAGEHDDEIRVLMNLFSAPCM